MEKKLAPHFVWLFALAAVGAGVGVAYATVSSSQWVAATAFALVFGGIACAGGWLTRSTGFQAAFPFAIASLGLGVITYIIIKSAVEATFGTNSISDAGGWMLGLYGGIRAFIAAIVPGIGGALFGVYLRGFKSPLDILKPQG